MGSMLFPWIFLLPLFKKKLTSYIGVDPTNQVHGKYKIIDSLWTSSIKSIISSCNSVICRGVYLQNQVLEINPNVQTINTIPLANFGWENIEQPSIKTKFQNKTLIYLGQINEGKGIFNLLNAMKVLPDLVKLIIVGIGLDYELARKYIEKEGLVGRVRFVGWVNEKEEIQNYFNDSSILVQPSINPEGVPRSIDEAIYYYTPVIATKVGGIPNEFAQGEINLIEPDDIKELIKAINNMLYNFDEYHKYSKKMLERRSFITKTSPAIQHIKFLNKC